MHWIIETDSNIQQHDSVLSVAKRLAATRTTLSSSNIMYVSTTESVYTIVFERYWIKL